MGETETSDPTRHPPRGIVYFTLMATGVSAVLFFVLLAFLPAGDSHEASMSPGVFLRTILTMAASGSLGGCLYNLRGLTKHAADNDYSEHYNLTYYLRPIQGAVCGIIVFFLILGGALSFNLSGPSGLGGLRHITVQLPYVAMALLAGYAATEFTAKMKDLAGSLFAVSTPKAKKEDKGEARGG